MLIQGRPFEHHDTARQTSPGLVRKSCPYPSDALTLTLALQEAGR